MLYSYYHVYGTVVPATAAARRKYGVPTILLQTKIEYHRLVISHKQYLILRGELGKALSTTYLLMRLLALGLPAQRTIKILGPA